MFPRLVEYVGRPRHHAGVVAAQHGEQVTDIVADVLEAPENVDGNGNCIAGAHRDFSILAVDAGVECPLPGVDDEYLGGFMTVLRVDAPRRLAGAADIESVRDIDMHVLVGILGDPGADDREVLLLGASGRTGVDERSRTGPQVPVSNHSLGKERQVTALGRHTLEHMVKFTAAGDVTATECTSNANPIQGARRGGLPLSECGVESRFIDCVSHPDWFGT